MQEKAGGEKRGREEKKESEEREERKAGTREKERGGSLKDVKVKR